ncbi:MULTISPECIES: hypothetical protein [Amycolatopsis]|nr:MULTISPECIES: hypothetical protein [Amycolatopsis]
MTDPATAALPGWALGPWLGVVCVRGGGRWAVRAAAGRLGWTLGLGRPRG